VRGPPFDPAGHAAYFQAVDRNKVNLAVGADVVVENFRFVAGASITRRPIEEYVRRPRAGGDERPELRDLTARERELRTLIARGQSNAEIAETLVVSEATVRTNVNRILGKLDLRDRTQPAVLAYETGLVTPGR